MLFLWLCAGGLPRGQLLSAQASGITLFPNCPDGSCPGQAMGNLCPLEQMRETWGMWSPSSPASGTASPGSTGGSVEGPISGHLPGFSPYLCTFLFSSQLLGSHRASRAGGGRCGQMAEVPCRFLVLSSLPAPQPHCSVGFSRGWHPLLLGRAWAASRGAAALSALGYFKPAAVAESAGGCWECCDPREGKLGKVGCSDRAGFMSLKAAI